MNEKRGNNPKERKSQDYKQTNFLEQLKICSYNELKGKPHPRI